MLKNFSRLWGRWLYHHLFRCTNQVCWRRRGTRRQFLLRVGVHQARCRQVHPLINLLTTSLPQIGVSFFSGCGLKWRDNLSPPPTKKTMKYEMERIYNVRKPIESPSLFRPIDLIRKFETVLSVVYRYGGDTFGIYIWNFRLRHKCSAGLEWRGLFGGACSLAPLWFHHFCSMHVHVWNHFFVGMPADFAIGLPWWRVVERFFCKKQHFLGSIKDNTIVITSVWLWRTLTAGTCDHRGIWEHSKKYSKTMQMDLLNCGGRPMYVWNCLNFLCFNRTSGKIWRLLLPGIL